MRRAELAMTNCLQEIANQHSHYDLVRNYRGKVMAEALIVRILMKELQIEEHNVIVNVSEILNRFGSNNIPQMVIELYNSFMEVIHRAENFANQTFYVAEQTCVAEQRYRADKND